MSIGAIVSAGPTVGCIRVEVDFTASARHPIAIRVTTVAAIKCTAPCPTRLAGIGKITYSAARTTVGERCERRLTPIDEVAIAASP